MAKDKIFVGSGRESGQFGYIAIGVAIEDIQKYAKKSANGKHYVNLLIGKRKEINTEKHIGLRSMSGNRKAKRKRKLTMTGKKNWEDTESRSPERKISPQSRTMN